MMRAWTELLPHVLFAWIARRHCQVMDQRAPIGRIVEPRPGVVLRVPADRAWGNQTAPDADTSMPGMDWELSDETKRLMEELERASGLRPGVDFPLPGVPSTERVAAARPLGIGQREEGGCRDAEQ